MDGRRRRRLAVAGDAGSTDTATEAVGGVGVLRARLGELPSMSPWLPRKTWPRVGLALGFWTVLALVVVALLRLRSFSADIQKINDTLTQGPRPILGLYAEIVTWMFAAEFSAIIGWYRAQSQSDFSGRYRLWSWATLVLGTAGFLAGTGLHTAIADVIAPRLTWQYPQSETILWSVPALLAGLSVWWFVDGDMRRSRWSVVTLRIAGLLLASALAGRIALPRIAAERWHQPALLAVYWVGLGMLVTSLWLHALFVAYVSADRPEPRARSSRIMSVLYTIAIWLWPLTHLQEEVPAKPTRRRRKTAESGEEVPTTRRKRKPAAKPKRTTRRTRKPAVEDVEETYDAEAEGYEAEGETDSEADAQDNGQYDSDPQQETVAEDSWNDTENWDEEALEAATRPDNSRVTATTSVGSSGSRNQNSSSQENSNEDWSDTESEDGYRHDDAHGGPDPFKGLSKKQRRELKKQMRERDR